MLDAILSEKDITYLAIGYLMGLGEEIEVADNVRSAMLKTVAQVRGEMALQAGGGEA